MKRCIIALCASLAAVSSAPRAAIAPPPQTVIAFEQRLGAVIPLSARFSDADGQTDTLAQFINGEPAIVLMGYNQCPNLCSTVRTSLAHALRATRLIPGTDYHVLAVSIDSGDTSPLPVTTDPSMDVASANMHGGWHFLRGDAEAVAALSGSIGFRYRYDADVGQYAHPAGIVIVTPQGQVSRYFLGVGFPPGELEASVIAASRERIGSPVQSLLLRCFHYDPTVGAYSLDVEYAVRILAAGSCVGLLALWLVLRRKPHAQQ